MATDIKQADNRHPLEIALTGKIETIRAVLPAPMRSEAERFIKRAMLTVFTGSQQLRECSIASIVLCAIKGAEYGLPIDGKLAHAVPYNNRKKDKDGSQYYEMEATFIPDYKGLVAVAKRLGIVQDVWARIVYENDLFELWEEDGESHYKHVPNLDSRGKPKLVFAVATHKAGWFRLDHMLMPEVELIRGRSKAKDYGPWQTDPGEMAKKTVLRRLLKTFSDDAGMMSLLNEGDDNEYEAIETKPPRSVSSLSDVTRMLQQQQSARLDHQSLDMGQQGEAEEREGEIEGEVVTEPAKSTKRAKAPVVAPDGAMFDKGQPDATEA